MVIAVHPRSPNAAVADVEAERGVAVEHLPRAAVASSVALLRRPSRGRCGDRTSPTSMRPSSMVTIGVVADEPGEPAGLDRAGEHDHVAARAVAAEQSAGARRTASMALSRRGWLSSNSASSSSSSLWMRPSSHGESRPSTTVRSSVRLFCTSISGCSTDRMASRSMAPSTTRSESASTCPRAAATSAVVSLATAARSDPADTFCATPGISAASVPSGPLRRGRPTRTPARRR